MICRGAVLQAGEVTGLAGNRRHEPMLASPSHDVKWYYFTNP